ncbi:SBBP repeat-containing protein [Hymenobacter nivis]|uniref:SBBP repeat-containing protein n=1 Tax=Hymenobacter nivis TaxID=1850093 RepID=UPI001375FD87|nr:SBBP repeat-containing protein [Hymenobacter nivis]
MATDKQGNAYVTGIFRGSIVLGTTTLTAVGDYDLFVAKRDAAGAYQWAAQAGGSGWDISNALAVDASGNVHVTGYCIGNSARFGPLKLFDAANLAPFDGLGYNLFVATLSADGTWQRLVRAGGLDVNNYLIGTSIAVDSQGNAYVAGSFRGQDARFGAIRLANEGTYNVFAACLGPAGTWRWAVSGGGNGYDAGRGIAVDDRDGVYLTGNFSSTALQLGPQRLPNASVFSNNGFVAKLNATTGAWQWAAPISSAHGGGGAAIAVDGRGDPSLTGWLGGGTAAVGALRLDKSTTDADLLVAKFDGATGACRWAVRGGGPGAEFGLGIALDVDGTAYVGGTFEGEAATFGQVSLRSAGKRDAVVASLDAAGQWRWALGGGGPGDDNGAAVAADGLRGAYVAGTFDGRTAAFGGIVLETGPPLSEYVTNRGFLARASDLALRSPAADLTLWPNPGRRGAPVWATGLPAGQAVQVFDRLGRLLVADARPGYPAQGLALPAALPSGAYVVRCGALVRRLVLVD